MRTYLLAAAASLALASPAFARSESPENFHAWLDRAVERNMVFPAALERNNVSGIAMIGFSVGAGGRPVDLEIVRSSGHSTIDRAALRTIATLDLPANAPAGPHLAVLQYGSAVNGDQDEAFAAALREAAGEARLALRALNDQRHARAGSAPGTVSTID